MHNRCKYLYKRDMFLLMPIIIKCIYLQYIYIYIHTYIHIHTHIHTNKHIYIHTYTYTHTHTYIHIYEHSFSVYTRMIEEMCGHK